MGWHAVQLATIRRRRILASRNLIINVACKRERTLDRYRNLQWSIQGLQRQKAYLRQLLIHIGFRDKVKRSRPCRLVEDDELRKEWESTLDHDLCASRYEGNRAIFQLAVKAIIQHSIVTGAGRFPKCRGIVARALSEFHRRDGLDVSE